jgi:exodeoxyribonuclease VII small subunit
MPKARGKESSFEESLSTLERVVAQLESGDLPLERALELFEEGVVLARRCQSQLEEAERKVELLLRERGDIKVIPFELSKESQIHEQMDDSGKVSNSPDPGVDSPGEKLNKKQDKEDEGDDLNDSVPF